MNKSSIDKRLDDFAAFKAAIEANKGHESELAYVLITATYLDNQLRKILESFFAPNTRSQSLFKGPVAPLGSFSSRIKLSYSLGLITQQEFLSIDAIRDIRNEFAHELTASFSDEKMTKSFDALAWAGLRDKADNADRGELLFIASIRLSTSLLNRADHVEKERRALKEWPVHRTDARVDDEFDTIY